MPKFEYTASGDDQKQHSGTLEAADENAARSSLVRLRLKPIVIRKVTKKSGDLKIPFLSKNKVKSKDLVIFTRQLATMINAGVPLVRSLATMQSQTESETLKTHLAQISKDVEGGASFADSLEKHSGIFNPIFVNMIRAGEAGGIMDEILKKCHDVSDGSHWHNRISIYCAHDICHTESRNNYRRLNGRQFTDHDKSYVIYQ